MQVVCWTFNMHTLHPTKSDHMLFSHDALLLCVSATILDDENICALIKYVISVLSWVDIA